jgi:hypothetical protein
MTWLILQLWLGCLIAFVLGGLVAWLVVRALYPPIDEVSAEVSDLTKGHLA